MILDFSDIIERLQKLQKQFNETQDATQRYAILQAIDHIGKIEIPTTDHWMETYRKAMLRDKDINV